MFFPLSLLVSLLASAWASPECASSAAQAHAAASVRSVALEYAYQRAHEKRSVAQSGEQAALRTAPLRVHFDTFYLGDGTQFDCKRVGQQFVLQDVAYTCEAKHILAQETKNKIVRVLAKLKAEIGGMLNIVRATSFELDDYPWCWDETINHRPKYGKNNPSRFDIDVLFFVTAWPTNGAAAWCGYCRLDQASGRPIAGHMNFEPGFVAGATDLELYAASVHELFHGLGFEANRMLKQVRDGKLVRGVEEVTFGNAADGTWTTHVLTSPNVLREARAHFNCPTLKGVPIEDYQKQGEVGSHWDKLAMGFEVINPMLNSDDKTQGPRISRLTLAYFADLGYYYPNYKAATPFTYGLGAGCAFIERPPRFRAAYSCQASESRCTADNLASGWCTVSTHKDCVDKWEQATDGDCNRAGNNKYNSLAVEAWANQDCTAPGAPEGWNGQTSGEGGRCFMSKVGKGGPGTTFWPVCHQVECPVPGAAGPGPEPEPEPEPTPKPADGPRPGTNFARITDCEVCTEANGVWCDQGWSATHARQGVCVASAGLCSSWQNEITDAGQCYPECTYDGAAGRCRNVPSCVQLGGEVFSSKAGANGCQKEPGRVMCCVASEQRKRALAAPASVVNASLEKRQSSDGVRVKIGGQWFQCPRDGGDVEVSRGAQRAAFRGPLRCPSVDEFCCAHKNSCNGRGMCVRGFCACNQGFTGLECEKEAEGPLAVAPSRANWNFPPQFLMELPSIEPPRPRDGDVDAVEDQVPDGFGGQFFASTDAVDAKSEPVDETTLITVVAVVVVLVVAFACTGAFVFFLLRWKKNQKPLSA